MYKTDSIDETDHHRFSGKDFGDSELSEGNDRIKSETTIKLNEHNIYQNVELKPGQIYEIIINNDDEKAVLTWDFESNRETLFTVFETNDDSINDLSNCE